MNSRKFLFCSRHSDEHKDIVSVTYKPVNKNSVSSIGFFFFAFFLKENKDFSNTNGKKKKKKTTTH